MARDYLGGRGLGAYLALRERLYDVEPLAPENLLIFAPGPLTGTGAPAAGRYSVTSRSPLTGTVFDGNSGGSWGVALRRLGLDYLIVGGACAAPSYLFVDGRLARRRGVRRRPLRGRPSGGRPVGSRRAGRARPRARAAPGCEAGVIGPAGERGVLFASIVNNRGRSVGRGGLGAVMGAKRLKAVVVAGHGERSPRWPTPTASRSSPTRRRSSSRPTRSPRRRCPSSARPCSSTC